MCWVAYQKQHWCVMWYHKIMNARVMMLYNICIAYRKRHCSNTEDGCLLGCCAVYSGRSLPQFQRCYFYRTTWRNNPEDSHLHTRHRENVKSESAITLFLHLLNVPCDAKVALWMSQNMFNFHSSAVVWCWWN
jgi:hypothetical protein